MLPENYLLLMVYPILLILSAVIDRFPVSRHFSNRVVYIGSLLFFLYLFFPFITNDVEYGYLILVSLMFSLKIFDKEMNIAKTLRLFTFFWLSLLSIWNFIGFRELLIFSGTLIALSETSSLKISRNISLYLILLFLLEVASSLNIVKDASIRLWLVEAIFLLSLLYVLFVGRDEAEPLSTTVYGFSFLASLLKEFGQLPHYFVYLAVLLQVIFIFSSLKEKKTLSIINLILVSMILILPHVNLSNYLFHLLIVYVVVFLIPASDSKSYRTVRTYCEPAFLIFLLFYIRNLEVFSGIENTLPVVILAVGLILTFLVRVKAINLKEFDKLGHT